MLGLGAAAIFPMSLAVMPVLFAPEERRKAIAMMASARPSSASRSARSLGGYLLDHFWWGSVFLINVPVVAVALVAVAFLLPESRSEQRPGDGRRWASLASSAGLAGVTYGCIKAGQDGWTDSGGAGRYRVPGWSCWRVRGLGALAHRPRRGVRPLVELGLFRSAGFTWGTILATFVSFAMFGIFFAHAAVLPGSPGAERRSAAGCGCCR